uniref:TIR domain-containing protein n=1 Tax=Candidatus Kentrum sp. SD TaxID=2126332 RepID=A0A450Y5F4_9GAMM|nr:MAG: TIR domain-containing protein [Candidatus Kentron sp. SD]VFK40345.1 MAG: TIR domain-containing protein [Candidatus Kentron sp. SD]
MLPPILEIYVLWHPRDEKGQEIAREFIEHFRGNAYTGLLGGAVEVFIRSEGWRGKDDAPRSIPFPGTELPTGIEPARFVALVPLMGMEMASAMQSDSAPWRRYMEEIVQLHEKTREAVGIFPYYLDALGVIDHTALEDLLRKHQRIAGSPLGLGETETMLRCRDLAQGITQYFSQGADRRLKVFISHTRQHHEGRGSNTQLISMIREIIANTRLRHFFDANDLQPGEDWDRALRDNAATGALLAVRTDSYSSRKWCQREILTAKRAGMPVVMIDALDRGEEKGSFLMDHVPRVPVRKIESGWNRGNIYRALGTLVDESLKRMLWRHQRELSHAEIGADIAWWAPHAPEPLTLVQWLEDAWKDGILPPKGSELRILHPEPPLAEDEKLVLSQMASLCGKEIKLDTITPRLLAARGG